LSFGTLQAASFSEFVDPHPDGGNQFGATILPLSTGNVVITSPLDDAGGTDAGAVYLFNGATGALISTVRGSSAFDQIGSGGVTALTNGNYVILSPRWDSGAVADAGAATWGSGTTGVHGLVRQQPDRLRRQRSSPLRCHATHERQLRGPHPDLGQRRDSQRGRRDLG
jgi:hypothetical protein